MADTAVPTTAVGRTAGPLAEGFGAARLAKMEWQWRERYRKVVDVEVNTGFAVRNQSIS
jgi:hypothetical protein